MVEATWAHTDRDGASLWCADYGGNGPIVMLLHGLCGYAGEWRETAAWLSATHRVLVPEQRGHGRSERKPADVSRRAYVEDAATWVELLASAPVALVGQSLGGHTGFLLASSRPDLVSRLVVAEASPDPDASAPGKVERWLRSWPVPFATRSAAEAFFGGPSTWASTWAAGLEEHPGGWWPAFDLDVMVASLQEASRMDAWADWMMIAAPTLVVRGADGLDAAVAAKMTAGLADASIVEVSGAAHDVHLEQPAAWRAALDGFLRGG